MSRGDEARCTDIVEAIAAIREYWPEVAGPKRDMAYDAVIRQLGIVGEASSRLSDSAKASITGIPWPKIIGFSNLVVHEYFRLDINEISVNLKADGQVVPLYECSEKVWGIASSLEARSSITPSTRWTSPSSARL